MQLEAENAEQRQLLMAQQWQFELLPRRMAVPVELRLQARLHFDYSLIHISKMVLSTVKSGPLPAPY